LGFCLPLSQIILRQVYQPVGESSSQLKSQSQPAFDSSVQQTRQKQIISAQGHVNLLSSSLSSVAINTRASARPANGVVEKERGRERERERERERGCPVRSPHRHLSVGASCEQSHPCPPGLAQRKSLNISQAPRLGRGSCPSPLHPSSVGSSLTTEWTHGGPLRRPDKASR